MRTFRIQSLVSRSLSRYQRDGVSGKIRAGLLARESTSGRLPDLCQWLLPIVLAYSGGSAGEWLGLSGTPLPYQALSGTVICIQLSFIQV